MSERIQELESEIDNLRNEIEELHSQLADNFLQTVQVLSNIISLFDRYHDGSHSRYVSQKSAEIARRLGLEEEVIFEIKLAGLFHDIGKIGLKDSLMTKFPSEMLQTEFRTYISHPEAGWEILRKFHGFENIAEIVYQHHERLDGTGHPRRLKGKEINPGAAIVSVVDTYHNSMYKLRKEKVDRYGTSLDFTSTAGYLEQTNYRNAATLNYLVQKSQTWFDSKVVDVFLLMIEEERRALGQKTIVRLPIGKLEPGLILVEDYYTSFGLLIAAKGEPVTNDMIKALARFAENNELPPRILVIK